MGEVKERYDNLDGLRAISCIAIVAMHIEANMKFDLDPFFKNIIVSWTQFVSLFLLISGFSMFCGYYDKLKSKEFDIMSFYHRRYQKILPFFSSLILIDILFERSISHLIEGAMEMTMVFGLLPNNRMSVIGVSWTLGVIFLFYILFPFFVFLCWDKRHAMISCGLSIIVSLFCRTYFFSERFVDEEIFNYWTNFLYCAPFFLFGGLIYLFRNKIKPIINKNKLVFLAIILIITVVWYIVPSSCFGIYVVPEKNLFLFVFILCYAISTKSIFLNNRVTKYLSSISLEIYLSQMVVFRLFEKIGLLSLMGSNIVSYFIVCISVVLGIIIFVEIWKHCYMWVQSKIKMIRQN